MKNMIITSACGLLLAAAVSAQAAVHHDLEARLIPGENRLEAKDHVTITGAAGEADLLFLLHAGLAVQCDSPGYTLQVETRPAETSDFSLSGARFEPPDGVPTTLYRLKRAAVATGDWDFALRYSGKIHHPVAAAAEEYARGFSETPGLVAAEGAYLCGATCWVPWFGDNLVTFRLATRLPEGWDSVSQGRRTVHAGEGGERRTTWECSHPTEEVYLVAGPFTEYSQTAGGIEALAFLRRPDPSLAARYLEATGQYLEMYARLIGPFPYEKFALVENFWETGYGMPSFTLLGEKVIRFPFILHSSYPHELLHNYWGNGVYVDYPSGNWCEGLTAYLADHLIAEGRGQGAEYRRATLQKLTDYVNPANDFPLTAFRNRQDAASEAIGYGKSLMMLHLLRRQIGDKAFTQGLQAFYRDNRYRRAAWSDLRRAFEDAAGQPLAVFFEQWTRRTGAPELALAEVSTAAEGGEHVLRFTLAQRQQEPPFSLDVPLAVTLAGESDARWTTVALSEREQRFTLRWPQAPVRLEVDPRFDLPRRLDRHEIPPSFSQIFGAGKLLIILPSSAPAPLLEAYRRLAEGWARENPDEVLIRLDTEIDRLPADRSAWIFGWQNRHAPVVAAGLVPYGIAAGQEELTIGGTHVQASAHSLAVAVRHPGNPAAAAVWLATANPAALPGLGRKLPHYGKYSYLAFEGDEPANILKGQWPAVGSPLAADPGPAPGQAGKLPERKALATLPPAFSEAHLRRHVEYLAGPELEGRGFGSAGLEQAARYISEQFKAIGLKPGGADSYFQEWSEPGGPSGETAVLCNVVGMLPGRKPEYAGQAVVVSAHYDHLGRGWPDVRQGHEGQIHPGADDNASGVAVLLELARVLAGEGAPERTIVFAAFTGEECGRRGSRHYLDTLGAIAAKGIMGVLNLDTVGRLGGHKLLVLGGSSAREWVHIFMGCAYVTGVPVELSTLDVDASDQTSFIERGVPGVQLFTGAHRDYHRPGDTADKIDYSGLVKVTSVAREAVRYLAERSEPLTFTGPAPEASAGSSAGLAAGSTSGTPPTSSSAGLAAGATGKPRRPSLGTMPDFAFQGEGVRVAAVAPGSPAAAAGILPGDVIVEVDGQPVRNLQEYTGLLYKHQPGERMAVVVFREGARISVEATLAAR